MAKPGPSMPAKIRGSTRFYPYFKDYIGDIDGHMLHTNSIFTESGLHNFRRRECRSDEFPIESNNESSSPPANTDESKPIFQTQEEQREIGLINVVQQQERQQSYQQTNNHKQNKKTKGNPTNKKENQSKATREKDGKPGTQAKLSWHLSLNNAANASRVVLHPKIVIGN
ncbi:hypothetical protein Ddye_004651 [Dipteronia dyeriana]|uniref:Uncharacterized protein n=1 Tax=Dipteronia dyeriana TaxID=168575 RepID=A0AAD9XWJ9_9ROSI|nr:hypothetical protein Ddye_004651 [Dipteronia dyeriana]